PGRRIYDIPPTSAPDPNYDIPIPSAAETQKTTMSDYSTLPILRKPEWIYVPMSPDKQSPPQSLPEHSPPDQLELYDTIPARGHPVNRVPKSPLLNNIPKSRSLESPPTLPPRVPLLPRKDVAEISTVSSSSSSSCDSLPLSSSSPEPLREVLLRQDEVCRRLLDLQDGVCRAVPRIMEFVSSGWRSKNHMEKHLEEIRDAAKEVATSLSRFLNFAMDIKGNARRLTDYNLQTRLYKQLCTVEDSGVILQQTVSALNAAGWTLDQLSQDAQAQTPDQLERFVMVARTIPEDVKRLVSMINANGKLLFKPPQKEPELVDAGTSNPHKPSEASEEVVVVEDDYVELQTKNDFENQQKEVQKDLKDNATVSSQSVSVSVKSRKTLFITSSSLKIIDAPILSTPCFVGSLRDGQPPEKFISQSKLVIMVGQRLVDTLYKEAQRGECRQSLLCKSSHLCALLKQLAVATKKAALHFPDRQAVHEAVEFAKELAQRAQHFRLSMNL
uniref:Cas scaffold protein family member 4 n=1 Tax=Neogobius melanostomus TaxID=47308 RepID=A0A8C6UIA9_9GOBI